MEELASAEVTLKIYSQLIKYKGRLSCYPTESGNDLQKKMQEPLKLVERKKKTTHKSRSGELKMPTMLKVGKRIKMRWPGKL